MESNVIIYPQSWTIFQKKESKSHIQCLGYLHGSGTFRIHGSDDKKNYLYDYSHQNKEIKPVRVIFPVKNNYTISYMENVTDHEMESIADKYDVSYIKRSESNPKTILLRDPNTDINFNDKEMLDITVDPHGELFSFFQVTGIKPYKPFLLKSGKKLKSKTDEIVIMGSESNVTKIKNIKIDTIINNIYWDIETINPRFEFPDPSSINDHIISISAIHESNNGIIPYFFYWGSYDLKNIKNVYPNAVIIRSSSEKDTIEKFLELLSNVKPDYMFTFNGDTYDVPYIITRIRIYDIIIPNYTKFNFIKIRTYQKLIKGSFSYERVEKLSAPGVNNIDLLQYFKKKYLFLPNYKLNTVVKIFLQEQKSDIEIKQMMIDFYAENPEGMEQLGRYSIKDSLLLYKLVKQLNIIQDLQNVANITLSTVEEVLDLDTYELIDRTVSSVDFGAYYLNQKEGITQSGEEKEGKTFQSVNKFKIGVYRDIYVYDYTNLYSNNMYQMDDRIGHILGKRSFKLWPELKAVLYWSKYIDKNKISNLEYMHDVSKDQLMEMNRTHIYTLQKNLELNGIFILDDIYINYVNITNSSYIYQNSLGEIYKVGTAYQINPDFKLADEYLNLVLNNLFDEKVEPKEYTLYELEDLVLNDINLFSIRSKIKDYSSYDNDLNFRAILAKQYNEEIRKWAYIHFYWIKVDPNVLKYGYPILIEKYNKEANQINLTYYIEKLKMVYNLLKIKKY